MARGSKKSYSSKQKREASHIEASEKKSGKSAKTAARIAWASVNKQDGGGKKSGSGRKKATTGRKKATTGRKKTSTGRTKTSTGRKKTTTARKKSSKR